MEIMYLILAIALIIAVIILMVILFRGKSKPRSFISFFNMKKDYEDDYEEKPNVNKDYELAYNGSSNMGETIKVGTVEVKITDERNPEVFVKTTIDPSVKKGGVSIGRSKDCDYIMTSRMIDAEGSFLVKKIGDNYVILANLNSENGLREHFGGERKNSICFKNGVCTCYIGTIRFDFTDICSYASAPDASSESKKANFYNGTVGVTQIN